MKPKPFATFNGRPVRQGKQIEFQRPTEITYKLSGASPKLDVTESVLKNGKRYFRVRTTVVTRTLGHGPRRGPKRKRSFGMVYTGHAPTLPLALRRLEKELERAFKGLADALGYELEG